MIYLIYDKNHTKLLGVFTSLQTLLEKIKIKIPNKQLKICFDNNNKPRTVCIINTTSHDVILTIEKVEINNKLNW